MPLTTVNVTGTINLSNGDSASGLVLEFRLNASDYDSVSNYVVPKSSVFAPVGTDGLVDVNLWPNDRGTKGTVYGVFAGFNQHSTGKPVNIKLGDLSIPSSGTTNFASLLS